MIGVVDVVDITPLTTAPNLRGLDLSRADVSDLMVLTELPDLRYLALTSRQWAILLGQGKTLPALTAACLTDGNASFDQALAWATCLGLDTEEALHITGKL
jgi:hypothetical protein